MEFKVCKEEQVAEKGSMFTVSEEGYDVLVVRGEDGKLYALEDRCSHADIPLSVGSIEDGTIECSAHGAKFELATGKPLCMPAAAPVETYKVDVREDGWVYVIIDS